MKISQPKKLLVIRNDKIGDFMLAWPSFALLKSQYPDIRVTALVPEYTAPLAKKCEWIDSVLIDDKKKSFFADTIDLTNKIKQHNYDSSISLFSEARTSLPLLLAGIKIRIGPATKIAQIFLNRTLKQKRSKSLKPEYEYNLDLIRHYINLNGDIPIEPPKAPFLHFDKDEIRKLRDSIKKNNAISKSNKIIIVHPGTGGSAVNLSIQYYATLIKQISEQSECYFIITAGPGEQSYANQLSCNIDDINHFVHESKDGIIEFCKMINICDLFISGSTGPLHIAGALNIATAAFYPAKRSATSLRWQTTNEKKYRLAFMPEKHNNDADLNTINIDECSKKITKYLLST